jgi:predicted RNase H-like HicB family nuclease
MQDQSFSEGNPRRRLGVERKNGLAVDNHAVSVMSGLSRPSTRFGLCAAGAVQISRRSWTTWMAETSLDKPGHDGEGLESHLRESYQACQPIAIIDKHGDELWRNLAAIASSYFGDEEDEGFIAIAPDLTGCSAFGETEQESLSELDDAIIAWISAAQAAGIMPAIGGRTSI